MRNVDYLIVGQGIAGTLLAYFLLKRNKEIFIVDQINPSSASRVGAGLFNPITGRRHVKTWMADTIFPFAEKTYLDIEQLLSKSFYHRINLIKMLDNDLGQDDLSLKANELRIAHYLVDGQQFANNKWIINTLNCSEIKETGYVDMITLITAFKTRMLKENRFIESMVSHDDLRFEGNSIYWKNIQTRKIIFCDGFKATQNHFFSWLPFVLAKGEILTIYAENLKLNKILNNSIFILPLGDDKYRVGSTYIWDNLDENPTNDGMEQLCHKLRKIIACPFTILDHKAGIRPTVKDRKPLIGLHPLKRNVAIFNGLGTKGASLAPYFANHFVEFLEDGKPLEKAVDIQRFYALIIDK